MLLFSAGWNQVYGEKSRSVWCVWTSAKKLIHLRQKLLFVFEASCNFLRVWKRSTLKSSRFAASFRGISWLFYAFMTLRWCRLPCRHWRRKNFFQGGAKKIFAGGDKSGQISFWPLWNFENQPFLQTFWWKNVKFLDPPSDAHACTYLFSST